MQSIKSPHLSSFGARRSKHGSGHRSTWAMWSVAVLLAVLAVAVPVQRTAWADPPDDHDQHNASVTIEVNEDSINYETATATITVTGAHTLFDKGGSHDADHPENWKVSYIVKLKSTGESITQSRDGGPGSADNDFDFTATGTTGEYTATVDLAEYYEPGKPINSLWPGQTHVVEATLSYDSPNYRSADTDTVEFDTKGECVPHPNAATMTSWHDGSPFLFKQVTRTTITLKVDVGYTFAPVNSGRCMTYDIKGGGIDERRDAYVYNDGSGGRQAWIIETGLMPGTYYNFGVNPDPEFSASSSGTGTYTLGPRLIIEVKDIEQTTAKVKVSLPDDERDHGERNVHLVYYKMVDEQDPYPPNIQVEPPSQETVDYTTTFDLSNLTSGTEYKVKASLSAAFPTHHTESATFTTKLEPPGKPTDLEVEPGDRQLEVSWDTPAAGGVVDEYIVQWKSGIETFQDATDDAIGDREALVLHLAGTTTFDTTISGLTNGIEYTVHVIAKNESGQAISDTATGTPDVLPDKPTIRSVVEGHTQLVVTWDEPASTGSDITGYVVQWKSGNQAYGGDPAREATKQVTEQVTEFSHKITGLENGTEYTVRVRAVNGLVLPVGDEEDYNWSDDATGTPRPDPSVSLTVKERSQTGATLTANIEDGNNVDHTVHLRFREKNASPPESWPNPTDEPSYNDSAEFTLSSLKAGTTYEVQAWLNDDSAPPDSDTFEFYTLPVVEDITFSDETRVSATATVSLTVADIDTSSYTVHLRYRKKDASPPDSWSNAPDESTSNGSAEFTLSSLDAGTTYEVQAWLDDDSPPPDSETFEFYTLPEVTAVSVSDEGQVSAKITVSLVISDIDTSGYAIHVRTSPPGEGKAFTPPPNSLEFTLPGLKSDTDYRVEAWTDNGFDNNAAPHYEFRTTRPTVSNVVVNDTDIEQTTATATVTIQAPNGEDQIVYLRYRPSTQADWSTTASDAGEITDVNSSTSTASIPIPNLKSDTLYEVEASLESDYSQSDTASFTTDDPTLTEITVSEVMQQSAKATISIQAHNGQSQMIYVRFRKVTSPVNTDWRDADATTSTINTATTPLSNLTSGTEYEAQASLDENFPSTAGVTVTSLPFTSEGPSLTGLTEIEVSLNSAKLKAVILAPNDEAQTVYYRYRPTSQTDWSITATDAGTGSTSSTTASAEIVIDNLNSSTSYKVQASLSSDLDSSTADVVSATITTLTPDPSISKVVISEKRQITAKATITIANPGTSGNTVHLHYREKGTTTWSSPALTGNTTGSETEVDVTISGLTADKSYDAELSLANDFSNSTIIPFITIPYPSVESVAVTDIGRTTAKVTVSINDEDGVSREVHLRYIVKSDTLDWTNDGTVSKTDDGGTDKATKDLENLSSGTTYILQASYDTNFVTGVAQTKFTTKSNPSVGSVNADTVTKTTARAVVEIANHDDTEITVELRYQIKALVQDWTDTTSVGTAQAISSDSGDNPVSKVLEGLSAGTEYVLQASLDSSFPDGARKEDTFTTARLPSIQSVSVGNEGRTSATATITIADHDGTPQTAKLQYRTTNPQGQWSTPELEGTSGGATALITIGGLTADTSYEVQAWLVTYESNKVTDTFRTQQTPPPPPQNPNPPRSPSPPPPVTKNPEISGVTFSGITQTSANARVSLRNAGSSRKTIRLHYREDGTTSWSTVKSRTTSGSSTTFSLTSLDAGTTYEVQAWLTSSSPPSGTQIYEFDTLDELAPVPDAAISNLKCENIGQTSATAMVEIANAGTDMKQVFLKHSIQGEDEWTMLPFPTITYDDDTSIPLTGLTEGTTYEVAVALSNDFSGMVIGQCTTLLLDPVVSGISVDRRKQTSVWANVSIANANGEDQTVHLRYRTTTPQGEWGDIAKTTTSTDKASKEIAGLTADTEYEVQASLDGSFPDVLTKNATFTTLRFPSISNLEVEDETKNSATAVITIADPDGSSQTIHLRYRTTTPQGAWSSTLPGSSTTSEASIGLTGLAPDTEYEVEVSLKSDFVVSETETFRTLPLDPVVSGINVDRRKQTSVWANVSIANANGEDQTVHLRYRTTTPRGDWSGIKTTTSDTDSASIDLSELTPGTEYDVQASLENSFPSSRTKHDTFTTLRWPSIASFEVENVGRNGATVNATISDSHGVPQTVHVRHRATGYIAWRPTQQVDSVDDVVSLRLRGLSSGTEYAAEASLDESFPSDETESVTFTTVKRKDDDDASSSGSGIVQAARAENIPLLGFSPQMLRFTAIEGGDNPAPQTFSVWNRAQGTMNFTLSNHEKWLSQDPLSGVSTGPADVVAISTSVDISGLPEGQYVDVINIQISPAGRSPGQVIVVLDVLPPDYIRQFVSRDEGGVITMPDGTVRLVVPPGSPPKDVDIELMKLNTEAHGEPPRTSERVVLALDSNTYPPGGDTPEDVAYSPAAELWLRLPEEDAAACDESRARVYSVKSGAWSLIEHRCETDESDKVWAVAEVERLGAFALVIDDAPVVATPTPVAAAVAPTPTAIPASAPAVIVQRISLPAQPPTPTPTQIPTPMPLPNGKRASVQTIGPAPTQTAVSAATESLAQTLQASSEDGDSGSFGSIVLAAISAPLIIGLFIVGYLAYRERRRTCNPNL